MYCHLLYQFAKDQPRGFFPFVLPTARAMRALLGYQCNARVRAEHRAAAAQEHCAGLQLKLGAGRCRARSGVFAVGTAAERSVSRARRCGTGAHVEVVGQVCAVLAHESTRKLGLWSLSDAEIGASLCARLRLVCESRARCVARRAEVVSQEAS